MAEQLKVLANDGMAADGIALLEDNGFSVETTKIPQAELPNRIADYDVIIVRSATQADANLLNAGRGKLKLVIRAGVGMDNVDLETAKQNGIAAGNTPNSSTLSVAELVFAHLFSVARSVGQSNIELRKEGAAAFGSLKKKYSSGVELRGKTLGIIGFGRIGQEVARIGLSLGLKVIAYDPFVQSAVIQLHHIQAEPKPSISVPTIDLSELLGKSDFISLHLPWEEGKPALIGADEIEKMKSNAIIVNCARGGVLDEAALIEALKSKKIAGAALDVFENEPDINSSLFEFNNVSLTPHIAASTVEGQSRIGIEVAEVILRHFGRK